MIGRFDDTAALRPSTQVPGAALGILTSAADDSRGAGISANAERTGETGGPEGTARHRRLRMGADQSRIIRKQSEQ
jgi:hypothetical protein